MSQEVQSTVLNHEKYITPGDHSRCDYFGLIRELVGHRSGHARGTAEYVRWQRRIDEVYARVGDELMSNKGRPRSPVSFGTSGWRGLIGKDLFAKSVAQVTLAIVVMYRELLVSDEPADALGVQSFREAQERGCVLGFDNRFGGELLAGSVMDVLTSHGFTVHHAGEATTGTLSAAVLRLGAAFSINLTPSHNPLEYAGFKYNAADGGPAAKELTDRITRYAREIIETDEKPVNVAPNPHLVKECDSLHHWLDLVRDGKSAHGLDYDQIMIELSRRDDTVVAVDCVHGASRVHAESLVKSCGNRVIFLRTEPDPTFGGIAPEPSTANMQLVVDTLRQRPEPLKLGIIMDPDADRVRFTDGDQEINMNAFGAMAYHFLHEVKGRKGMVAKSVATSNFANALAAAFGEEVFEPMVGFKEFKPVIGRALVCFEESDGISVIRHTPEKDAYIGLLLAMDMVLTLGKNLGEYLKDLQNEYGSYFPARDAVRVSQSGEELGRTLARLEKFGPGAAINIGGEQKRIKEVIAIDGRKMILEDDSWLMIRPSGTEPKVRFYVEARTDAGKDALFTAARGMLAEIGLLG
jgi:phosphomannomutase